METSNWFYALADHTANKFFVNCGTNPTHMLYEWRVQPHLPPTYARYDNLKDAKAQLKLIKGHVKDTITYYAKHGVVLQLGKAELDTLEDLKKVNLRVVKVHSSVTVQYR